MNPTKIQLSKEQTDKLQSVFDRLKDGVSYECGTIFAQIFPAEITGHGVIPAFMSVMHVSQGRSEQIREVLISAETNET